MCVCDIIRYNAGKEKSMKSFNRIFVSVVVLLVAIVVLGNLGLYYYGEISIQRQYRVDANRIASEIEQKSLNDVDISKYQTIRAVYELKLADGIDEDFFESNNDYVVRQVGDSLYRIEYAADNQSLGGNVIFLTNVAMILMAAVVIAVLLYVRQKILKPFDRLKEVPYELSKGNLTVPVKESKNRFFGRFVWGVDMLRENLELQKQRELELQKENKTLVLSLSHDIKTPLSAIKLYAKALSKGLYSDAAKQAEIAENINVKADEIEGYVSDIIKASNDDFLDLQVEKGEIYLSQIIESTRRYYDDKLGFVKTEFKVGQYSDCLIKGDENRLIEVLQNIMENAIKYGDGKYIEIGFGQEEDCRLITVKNSGCSLNEAEITHIFDSFWRGSNVGDNKGSGLGLYICKKLMQAMDGEIYAQIDGEDMCVTVVTRLA